MIIYRAKRTPLADAWRALVLASYGAPNLLNQVFGGSIDQLLNKEAKSALPKGPFDSSPGEWGSVQYDTAALVYNMWFEARKVLSFEEALYSFSVSKVGISYEGLVKAKEEMIDDLLGDEEDWRGMGEEDYARECGSLAADVRAATTYDKVFYAARESSWDLWSAAHLLSHSISLYFESRPPLAAVPSYVPVLNAMAQQSNFPVGLSCAIARELGLVGNKESFFDFDT